MNNKTFLDKYFINIICVNLFIVFYLLSLKFIPRGFDKGLSSVLYLLLALVSMTTYYKLKSFEKKLITFKPLLLVGSSLALLASIVALFSPLIFNYKEIQYVYACPGIDTTKCYHIRATMASDSDEEGYHYREWVGEIFFDNGGSVKFRGCEKEENVSDRFTCWEDDSENWWTIDLAEKTKVQRDQ